MNNSVNKYIKFLIFLLSFCTAYANPLYRNQQNHQISPRRNNGMNGNFFEFCPDNFYTLKYKEIYNCVQVNTRCFMINFVFELPTNMIQYHRCPMVSFNEFGSWPSYNTNITRILNEWDRISYRSNSVLNDYRYTMLSIPRNASQLTTRLFTLSKSSKSALNELSKMYGDVKMQFPHLYVFLNQLYMNQYFKIKLPLMKSLQKTLEQTLPSVKELVFINLLLLFKIEIDEMNQYCIRHTVDGCAKMLEGMDRSVIFQKYKFIDNPNAPLYTVRRYRGNELAHELCSASNCIQERLSNTLNQTINCLANDNQKKNFLYTSKSKIDSALEWREEFDNCSTACDLIGSCSNSCNLEPVIEIESLLVFTSNSMVVRNRHASIDKVNGILQTCTPLNNNELETEVNVSRLSTNVTVLPTTIFETDEFMGTNQYVLYKTSNGTYNYARQEDIKDSSIEILGTLTIPDTHVNCFQNKNHLQPLNKHIVFVNPVININYPNMGSLAYDELQYVCQNTLYLELSICKTVSKVNRVIRSHDVFLTTEKYIPKMTLPPPATTTTRDTPEYVDLEDDLDYLEDDTYKDPDQPREINTLLNQSNNVIFVNNKKYQLNVTSGATVSVAIEQLLRIQLFEENAIRNKNQSTKFYSHPLDECLSEWKPLTANSLRDVVPMCSKQLKVNPLYSVISLSDKNDSPVRSRLPMTHILKTNSINICIYNSSLFEARIIIDNLSYSILDVLEFVFQVVSSYCDLFINLIDCSAAKQVYIHSNLVIVLATFQNNNTFGYFDDRGVIVLDPIHTAPENMASLFLHEFMHFLGK